MGEVFRATDTRLGRDVALKILPAVWTADAQRRTRFEREARAVAALHHPNICTIHDVGHDQGIDFLVMELVNGESLATRLSKGPLPLDAALARAIEIADALDSAHRQGIIHRDLKPGNIMLASSGSGAPLTAKLLDFGLARIAPTGVEAGSAGPTDPPMTEAGALLGTVQYMAPEQIEGRPADARTDIFAFGAVLYEMLSGRRAFEGTSTASLMAAILRADAPSLLPRDLGRVVRRCLAKDPLHRYQSARDLLNDLEEIRLSLDSGSVTPSQPQRRLMGNSAAWLALGLVVVAIATAGYVGWRRPGAGSTVMAARFQLQPPPGVEVLPSGVTSVLAVSPDGQWVAFGGVSGDADGTGLYVRSIRDVEARKIASAGRAPFFSPDSRWLGFFVEKAMYKVPVDGDRPQQICKVPDTLSQRGASWGDDGTIVFSSDKTLWRVPASGGEPTALTRPTSSPTSNVRHYWPQVLPGSAAAVFTINEGYNDRFRRIGVVSMRTGDVRTFPALSGSAPRYVPSGHLVYSRHGVLHAVPFNLSRLEVTGEPVKVLDGVSTHSGSGSAAFDVSASGSLVYIPGVHRAPEGDLVWLDRQGKITPLVEHRKPYTGAAVDPDGKRLAVSIAGEYEEADIWVYEIERGSWTRLTNGMHTWTGLVWSPDGKWIFFTSFTSGEGELFRIPSRGGSPEQLTSDISAWEYAGSVSPDGTTLLFWKSLPSQSDLMTMPIEPRGSPVPFTDSPTVGESSPRISPDGRWVAYDSDESGSRQVHVRPFPGPGEGFRVSPHGGAGPAWSRDGREIVYQRRQEIWAVAVQPGSTFRHANPRMLFKTDSLGNLSGSLASGEGTTRFLAIRREQPKPIAQQLVYAPNWVEELKR